MNLPLYFTKKVVLSIAFVTLWVFGNTTIATAQTSHEYAVADINQLITDITASAYDEYILTTSGGVYDFTSAPDISVSATIRGADGLAEKPVLSYTTNSSSSFGIFRVRNATEKITVTFDNLEFDCSADVGNVTRVDSETDMVVKNCYIHDNSNSNGVFRFNTAGSSISIENSLFYNCKQRVIHMYTPDAVYGAVNITNSSFNDIQGPVIYYRSSGTVAIGTDVTVDHATFNNIGGSEGVFKFRDMQGTVTVKNSIFTQVAGTLDEIFVTADYCYVNGFETVPTATNSIETDPVYADAANNNFTLTNADQLTAGDMQILGDLSWYNDVYPPVVFPELLKEDDTHVRVQFNEMVEAATAEVAANYTLAGSFGLTGNPAGAVLAGDSKSVLLEISDISAMTSGQTVSVVVKNVKDIMGNVIAGDSIAVYTYLDEVPPVVTMAAQEVSNDAGSQVVLQSSETGTAYLIMDGEPQGSLEDFQSAVDAGKGTMDTVESANNDVNLSAEGLMAGTYYAYTVDGYDNISAKSDNAVTITDQTAPVVSVMAAEVTNAANADGIPVMSSEPGSVYLVLESAAQSTVADLDAAVTAGVGATGTIAYGETEATVSMAGVTPGAYYAYAVDLAGNISAVSTEYITVTEYVPRVRYYAVEDAAQLSVDLVNANNGDMFVLTTSGGEYNLSYWHKITSKITIMADKDLEKRPIISNYIENSTYQTFRLFADGASLTLKGLEIDSKNNATYPLKYMLRIQSDIGNYSLVAEDCYFHGELKATGTIFKAYGGTHADSIIFRNCIFENSAAIVMNGLSTEESPSWDKMVISNCTFINIPDEAVTVVHQPELNKEYPIDIDHCTFYNTGSADKNIIVADSMINVSVTNSIFAQSPSESAFEVFGDDSGQSVADYNNYFNCDSAHVLGTGIVGSNNWTLDPQFADADNGDLTLGNQALYTLGSDGLPLGDLRWADVLGPDVLPEVMALSDTTLLIRFSEWVDTTSATNPAYYALSGSAGLTGTAKKAELYNFHAVVITTESFMGKVGDEVVVTVSDVTDLKGNTVNTNQNSTTYVVEEMRPVVFAQEQTVTNADGQVVVVQSSLGSGFVYVIMDGVDQATVSDLDAAVANGQGAKTASSVAYTDIEIPVHAVMPGTYYAYFVDGSGTMSEKGTSPVTITDGIAPEVTADVQSAENGADSYVLVQSNEDNGKVYIILDGEPQATTADFITAVALKKAATASVTEANADVQLSTAGLEAGIYYAYAIDAAGNISAKGTNPVNITTATGIDPLTQQGMKIYSTDQKVIVEAGVSVIEQVTVINITGKVVESNTSRSDRFVSARLRNGIYFIRVLSADNMVEISKIIVK